MTNATSSLCRIRLERAREPGHPEGDAHIGYTLIAPLSADGRIDAEAWHEVRARCTVVRFGAGQGETGVLRRRPGGSWAFHYETGGIPDDDAGYRFDAHRFVVGEYVTINEDEGAHTYRVAAVTPP